MTNSTSKSELGDKETFKKENNLYIKPLPFNINLKKFQSKFEEFGEIHSAKIVYPDDSRNNPYGFVCFIKNSDAQKAINQSGKLEFDGKAVTVNVAQKRERSPPPTSSSSSRKRASRSRSPDRKKSNNNIEFFEKEDNNNSNNFDDKK